MSMGKTEITFLPPFLRLLNPFISLVRFFGLFPANNCSRYLNIFHYTIVTILLIFDFYLMTYKLLSIVASMLSHITASSCIQLAVFIYFYLAFSCVVFVATTGQKKKLEQFSELLYQATEQKACWKRFASLRRKIWVCTAFLTGLVISISAFLPLTFSDYGRNLPGADVFRTLLFVDAWYINTFVAIVVALNALANGMWILTYFIVCECLKEEFYYVSDKLRQMDIRENDKFKKVALEHSRLLNCASFLHDYLSLYVFVCLADLTIMSVIFAYLLMLDIALVLRLLAGFWLIANVVMSFVFCHSAETLHSAAKQAKELVCSKMTEEHSKYDLDDVTRMTAGLIIQQASIDAGFTALGFFVVSKQALLALFSFIATYVVILLQSPKIVDAQPLNETGRLNA